MRHRFLTKLRADARAIFAAGLAAADPVAAIGRHVSVSGATLTVGRQPPDIETPPPDSRTRSIDLGAFERVSVVGAGKASAAMAGALEELLGDRIDGGLVVVKDGYEVPLSRVEVKSAGHPVPDQRGVEAAEALIETLTSAAENTLVLCLISGGASALLVAPAPGIDLADKQAATRLLLASGATIHEINTVRKHLSRVKGGQLARLAQPSPLITLILSDVVGDNLDVIGSGPTVADSTTFADAEAVLRTHSLWHRVAPSIRSRIEAGAAGREQDTPKPGDPAFDRCVETLVGTNLQAIRAAADTASHLGYSPLILTSRAEGEAREVARVLVAVAREIRMSSHPLAPPACILMGGETTVTLRGEGKGGRNQEFALAASLALGGIEDVVVLAGGTDGSDGPTEAAGALVDDTTLERARRLGLDPGDHLRRNDAHGFFTPLNDLLITGPTRTNVMDIYLALIG